MSVNIAKILLKMVRCCVVEQINARVTVSSDWEDDQGNPGFTVTIENQKYEIIVKVKD